MLSDPCDMAGAISYQAKVLCQAARAASRASPRSQASPSTYAPSPTADGDDRTYLAPPPPVRPGFTRLNVVGNLYVDQQGSFPRGYAGQWNGVEALTPVPVTQTWYVNRTEAKSAIEQPATLARPDGPGPAQFGFSVRGKVCYGDITGTDQTVLLTETPQRFRISNLHTLTPNRVSGCLITNTLSNFSPTVTLSADARGNVYLQYVIDVSNVQGNPVYRWESANVQLRNAMTPDSGASAVGGSGPAQYSGSPAGRGSPPQRSRSVPVQTPDNGPYRSDRFSGLTTWRSLFEKAAHSPAEFAKIEAKIAADGNGAQGMIVGLARPERNSLQKTLTDYELYKLYHRSPEALLAKQDECLQPRDYSPEEACDCLAGFPGDTLIGPGAGELVISSNHTAAVKACGVAAANAATPALRSRYLAQRARAQIPTTDPAQAVNWAAEAVAAGYRRATIIKAEGNLWDIEFRAGGFPPMTQREFESEVREGIAHLKEAKAAGVRETYIVARKYSQMMAHMKFNNAVLTPILKAMLAPPPKSPCGPDSRDNEGHPIPGTGCIGHR